MIFFGNIFRKTVLLITLFELISFFGFLTPSISKISFIILIILFLLVSIKKMEFGLYILLAELFIGSKGYLFFFEVNGKTISIRIAFWLILMMVWFVRAVIYIYKRRRDIVLEYKNKSLQYLRFFNSSLAGSFLVLFVVFALSLLNGIFAGNGGGNVFNDFNAYLFFALVFVVYDTITRREQISEIVQVLTGSLVVMSFKTLGLLYLFSHKIFGISYLYKWVRTSGVGEITNMGGDYYRIFFQSHIYIVIGFLLVLVYFLMNRDILLNIGFKNIIKNQKIITLFSLLILFFSVILVSLSRSFWLGLIFGFVGFFTYYVLGSNFKYKKYFINFSVVIVLLFYFLFIYKQKYFLGMIVTIPVFYYILYKILHISKEKLIIFSSTLLLLSLFSVGLVNNIVNFPIPSGGSTTSLSDVVGDRAVSISGEAAVGSRWSLLKPLSASMVKFPTILVGAGFGETVTYISSDPRVLENDPTGKYTTYAFEWGYLDFWLKFGIIGLVFYLILLFKVFMMGFTHLKNGSYKIDTDQSRLVLGLLLGLIVVVVVHGFTPYLNHPLGIGYLLMCVIVFDLLGREKLAHQQ